MEVEEAICLSRSGAGERLYTYICRQLKRGGMHKKNSVI